MCVPDVIGHMRTHIHAHRTVVKQQYGRRATHVMVLSQVGVGRCTDRGGGCGYIRYVVRACLCACVKRAFPTTNVPTTAMMRRYCRPRKDACRPITLDVVQAPHRDVSSARRGLHPTLQNQTAKTRFNAYCWYSRQKVMHCHQLKFIGTIGTRWLAVKHPSTWQLI